MRLDNQWGDCDTEKKAPQLHACMLTSATIIEGSTSETTCVHVVSTSHNGRLHTPRVQFFKVHNITRRTKNQHTVVCEVIGTPGREQHKCAVLGTPGEQHKLCSSWYTRGGTTQMCSSWYTWGSKNQKQKPAAYSRENLRWPRRLFPGSPRSALTTPAWRI